MTFSKTVGDTRVEHHWHRPTCIKKDMKRGQTFMNSKDVISNKYLANSNNFKIYQIKLEQQTRTAPIG
jgi:hypothetical protein